MMLQLLVMWLWLCDSCDVTLSCTPSNVVSPKEKEKKENINNDLAILPSYETTTIWFVYYFPMLIMWLHFMWHYMLWLWLMTYDLGHVILSCTLLCVVSPKKRKEKKRNINNNLAVLPSHDNQTEMHSRNTSCGNAYTIYISSVTCRYCTHESAIKWIQVHSTWSIWFIIMDEI